MEDAGDATRDPASSSREPVSAWRTHLTLAIGLALCAGAFWFELHRALGGNELSWAYVFEWPLLGVFAVYMWWRVLHPAQNRRATGPVKETPEVERMRVAWQEYQRSLQTEAEAEPDPRDPSGRS
ncbi:MAG TPA: hypothetical protein VND83_06535 [Acidimicrobiales bacterium]|nr:hypothetical protein [Acidimicrobiales bacterium]